MSAAEIYDHIPTTPPTPTADALATAYRLHGIARAGIAASDTVMAIDMHKGGYRELFEVINVMAGDVIDGIEQGQRETPATPAPVKQTSNIGAPCASDGAAALYDRWSKHNAAWRAFANALDPKAEPPELDYLGDVVEQLAQQIAHSTPTTNADAAAMLRWVVDDCDGSLLSPEYATAQMAVAKYLDTA